MPKVVGPIVERPAAIGAVVLRRRTEVAGERGCRVQLDDLAIVGTRLDIPRLEHNHGIIDNVERLALRVLTTSAGGGGSLGCDGFLGALGGRAAEGSSSSCVLMLDHCRR